MRSGRKRRAKKEFTKLGAIDPETESDVEILQAYLDLFGEDQSFAEKKRDLRPHSGAYPVHF